MSIVGHLDVGSAVPRTVVHLCVIVLYAVSVAGAPTSSHASPSLDDAGSSVAASTLGRPADRVVTKRLRAAVKALRVARETRQGYDRDKFGDWIDADDNCLDTRDEVLKQESRRATNRGCEITRGRWFSYYDGLTSTRPSALDIDHMVPLAEAWDSGAKRWNAGTRKRFANDLGDPRSLVAVTNSVNRSKGDRDPAEWLPPQGRCRYVTHYTAVKLRWSLRVDRRESRALRSIAQDCPNRLIRVTRARIGSGGGGGGGDDLDPRFDYCYQAIAAGYGPYRRGRDPEYHWYTDADGDGWVCES